MSTATGHLNWPFAATWAGCTFIGWLTAIAILPTSESGAVSYLLAGIFTQLVTLGLRWQLLHRPATSETSSDRKLSATWSSTWAANDRELTWLLCWVSQIHVVGIAWLGHGILTASGVALTLLVSESLLLRFAPPSWNDRLPNWLAAPFRPDPLSPVRAEPDQVARETANATETADADENENDDHQANVSVTCHGRSEDGLPFLHGWQRYEMMPGQKSVSLTIGFFPPFLTPPDCELDHAGEEEVSYDIEHITPAGARISLKRRVANQQTKGKLSWHCCPNPEQLP